MPEIKLPEPSAPQTVKEHVTSYHDLHSRALVEEYHEKLHLHDLFKSVAKWLIPKEILEEAQANDLINFMNDDPEDVTTKKVGIVGAGVAGLYAAMILQDLGVPYEILEAEEEHVGGRLRTHYFSEDREKHPNDYYDIGAMRFPNTLPMWRTFDLFRRLNFTGDYISDRDELERLRSPEVLKDNRTIRRSSNPYQDSTSYGPVDKRNAEGNTYDVIPYLLTTGSDLQYFNGLRWTKAQIAANLASPHKRIDLFDVSVSMLGPVPDEYVRMGPQYWMDAKIGFFKNEMVKDFAAGREFLMNYDEYSVRQFFTTVHPELARPFRKYMLEEYPDRPLPYERAYPQEVVNWLETCCMGTAMFDRGLSEIVFEELDFNYTSRTQWQCIQGGANRIAQSMRTTLSQKVQTGKRVTAISPAAYDKEVKRSRKLAVQVACEDKPREYSHVISTVPLGCLRTIDLDKCKLSYPLREALRSLQYGPSVKIGMKFSSRWWEKAGHFGGVSSTDRLSRMIVYPSYGIGGEDATMLVSYSWSQDALRLASLIKSNDKMDAAERYLADQVLVGIVLNDLAKVHDIPVSVLEKEFVEHHAYDWYRNELAVGAFAFFGPGQFGPMYTEVTQPAADHMLFFAGEATSTTHAWVVGALDSAVRAVYQILVKEGWTDKVEKLRNDWKLPSEMEEKAVILQLLAGQDEGRFAQRIKKIRKGLSRAPSTPTGSTNGYNSTGFTPGFSSTGFLRPDGSRADSNSGRETEGQPPVSATNGYKSSGLTLEYGEATKEVDK